MATDVTALLQRVAQGDAHAAEAVAPELYGDLRHIAHAQRRRWRGEPTLATTALLHEAWMKVSSHRGDGWASREHFYATCTRAMRQILLNHAQASVAAKRGGAARPEPLHDGLPDLAAPDAEVVLDVASAIDRLRDHSPRQADVVEHRVFGGFSVDEVAQIMELSPRTVKREWQKARAWLGRLLQGEAPAWQALI